MKKILFLLTLVALVSCGTSSQNGSSTDTLSGVKPDSAVGTQVDSTKADSTKVDSTKVSQ